MRDFGHRIHSGDDSDARASEKRDRHDRCVLYGSAVQRSHDSFGVRGNEQVGEREESEGKR